MPIFVRARLLAVGLVAASASLIATTSAQAGVLATSGVNCGSPTLSQVFLPWGDPAQYQLAPGGSFEPGAPSWQLSGGAQTVTGNESFDVGSPTDSQSLALPPGSSATSPTMCVGIQNPDLRLFVRNIGNPNSTLQVSVNWEDANGDVETTPIGMVVAGSSWTASPQIVIAVNLLPLMPGNMTPVSFNVTPQGQAGNWQIDDFYVDPWYRS